MVAHQSHKLETTFKSSDRNHVFRPPFFKIQTHLRELFHQQRLKSTGGGNSCENIHYLLYNLGHGTAQSGRLPCKEDISGERYPDGPPSSWPVWRCRKLVKHGAAACPPQGIFQRCWASPKTAQCPPMVSSSKWIGNQPLKLVIVSSNLREITIKIYTANFKSVLVTQLV